MSPGARRGVRLVFAAGLLAATASARLEPTDPRLPAPARTGIAGAATLAPRPLDAGAALGWHGLPPSPLDDADRKGAIATALSLDAWAPRENWDPDSSGYDAVHVSLEVEPDFAAEGLTGTATWELAITDPAITGIEFDFTSSLEVTLALVDDEPAPFTHADDRLRLQLPYPVPTGQIVRATVAYSGVPELGFLWGFDYRTHDGVPIVFTNCEPIAARTWWPCKDRPDDKFTADLVFIVPDTMIAASNGRLVERRDLPGGRRRFAWRESDPITTYLVALTATNFVEFDGTYTALDGTTRMPLAYFAYPEHFAQASARWAFTPEAIHCLAGLFGEYPYLDEKYGMVEYPWSGAMEHQTLSSMGDYFQVAPQSADWVIVHELAHQWWGDLVTCGTWRDIWLNEGFATYCEALWAESRGGPDSLRAVMLTKYSDHFPGSCYDPNFLFNSTVYRKGAWVLHMLRRILGDAGFFGALRLYAQRHAHACAVTADLQAVCEEVHGAPLDWFFDPWVYGPGQPSFRVRWEPVAELAGDSTLVRIRIDQSTTGPTCFKVPLDAVFSLDGGREFTTVLWDSLAHQEFTLVVPGWPAELAVDPDRWVLGKVLFVAGPAAAEDLPPERPVAARLGAAHPNPAREAAWIPFELPAGTPEGLLRISDASGRTIRRIPLAANVAGRGAARWDGRDEAGAPAPAGVYFAAIEGAATPPRKETRTRILLLR